MWSYGWERAVPSVADFSLHFFCVNFLNLGVTRYKIHNTLVIASLGYDSFVASFFCYVIE